jgi:hypothetical protein
LLRTHIRFASGQGGSRARIVEKAAQGPTALIHYLHRTQTVHQLRAEFVIRETVPAPMAAIPDEVMVALVEPAADARE